MRIRTFLLPAWFKIPGWILLIPGLALTILDMRNIKLSIFNAHILAVFSYYTGPKTFTWINTNLQDEITVTLLLLSLLFIILSRDKKETEHLNSLRASSMSLAFIANTVLIIISTFLIYGLSYIVVLEINLISFQLLFFMIFTFRKLIKVKPAGEIT